MERPLIPGLNIPVRSIFCIGRNYAKHAAEMGAEVPSTPVVFIKPLSTICFDGDVVEIPKHSSNVHFEGEIVLAIGKAGKNISESDALKHISGIGGGIDFTARDLQKEAKLKGLPWSVSKGFEHFAPISTFQPISELDLSSLEITLDVNGERRQTGLIKNMIFSISNLISYLSTINTLYPGDLIFTGTPEGVGKVTAGDQVKASIPQLDCSVSVKIS